MVDSNLRLRCRAARGLLLFLVFGGSTVAQEPSQTLEKADALYRAGSAAFIRNDLETALSDFQKFVHLVPSAEAGHSAVGLVLLRMGRVQESVPELEQALKLKPSDAAAQMNLAIAYEQLGQPEKELVLLARMDETSRAQKRPLPADVSAMYARALAATHRLPAAVARMQQAVAADPHNADLLDSLGSLYAMQQDWPNAERNFRAALSVNPNLASAHLHLGLALQAQHRPGATDELAAAYRLAPDNPVANLEYGRALAAEGNDAQAVPLLQHANELPQHPIEATYQLALALQRSNRTAEAIPLFESVAAAEPANAEVLTNLGMALCQQQKAAQAVPILQKAVSLAPKNPIALQDLAAAYIQLNQFDDAVVQLRAAIPFNPDSPQLHYNLGVAFKLKDDPVHAIPELEQAEKLDPNQPEAPYALGMLYMQGGRYEDAARELKLSLTLRPQNGDAWATLGSVYNKLNKLPESEAALKEAIAQLPEQPDPHLTLAAVLTKENKPDDALAERKVAANLMRNNMNRQRAEVATHSGESLLKSGDLARAMVQFNDAISFDPTFSDAHEGLAKVYDAQGRTADAASERSKVAVKAP